MKKFKKLTTMLLLMAMVLSMGGCGSKDSDKSKDDSSKKSDSSDEVANGENVEVNILQYKIEIEDALQAAAKKYQELYPNVKINVESVGGADSVDTLYKAKAASGSMPDIFNCAGPVSCDTYADYLEDLSDQPWLNMQMQVCWI